MSSLVSRGLLSALVAGGITLLGATAAHATELADHHDAEGHAPLASLTAPVTASGNAIALLGTAHASTTSPGGTGHPAAQASPVAPSSPSLVQVTAPVVVQGNAVAVGGSARSTSGHTHRASGHAPASSHTHQASGSSRESRHTGSRPVAAVQVPVTVAHNAVAVLGVARSSTSSDLRGHDGSTTTAPRPGDHRGAEQRPLVGIVAPVRVASNAVAVLGHARTDSRDGSTATRPARQPAGGSIVGVSIPVDVSGNALAVLGAASSTTSDTASDSGTTPDSSATPGSGITPSSGTGSTTAPDGSAGTGSTGSTGSGPAANPGTSGTTSGSTGQDAGAVGRSSGSAAAGGMPFAGWPAMSPSWTSAPTGGDHAGLAASAARRPSTSTHSTAHGAGGLCLASSTVSTGPLAQGLPWLAVLGLLLLAGARIIRTVRTA